jgi:cyclic pyranopterin phosphate synthase
MCSTKADACLPPGPITLVAMTALADRFRRPVRDLRISVTDRCNFRCTYCMPKELFGKDHEFLPRDELLSFEEIKHLVGLFVERGVEKVRITGGEPLLRKDLEKLVGMLRAVEGVEDLTLTTNASLLVRKARSMAAAGLDRVTVSLDALDDPTFQKMNDVGFPVGAVLEGIDAAAEAGLGPIKVNAVVQRGVNEHAVLDLAGHFKGTGHIVRFIEYMDVGTTNGWRLDDVVPAEEMISAINEVYPLEPVPPNYPGEVANRFRYVDGSGEVGVIASVTKPFCGSCTRARVSAEGTLYTCLFATGGSNLRDAIRAGEDVGAIIDRVWSARDDRYSEIRSSQTVTIGSRVEMSYIGG